jgi:hypothetical protein
MGLTRAIPGARGAAPRYARPKRHSCRFVEPNSLILSRVQTLITTKIKKAPSGSLFYFQAGDGTRTRDLLITNQLLYQLSYASTIEAVL